MTVNSASTCWLYGNINPAKEALKKIADLGLPNLELEFRIGEESFDQIIRLLPEFNLGISSMHAVCPMPAGKRIGAERFLLNDEHEQSRQTGVADVIFTLQKAAELNVPAIVLHAGRIEMDEPIYKMQELHDSGELAGMKGQEALHDALLTRMRGVKNAFPQLINSLHDILPVAEKLGVKVGLENRYYFREMPNLEEFGVIFNSFDTPTLGYWHDTGHAHVQENMFEVSQQMMLESFGHRMIGVHLHDVTGYRDHNQPGSGEVDFDMVARYLPDDAIRVIELNKRVTPEEAKQGVSLLRDKKIFI